MGGVPEVFGSLLLFFFMPSFAQGSSHRIYSFHNMYLLGSDLYSSIAVMEGMSLRTRPQFHR